MKKEWSCHPLDEVNKAVEVKDHKENEERESEQTEKSTAKGSEYLFKKFPKTEWQTMKGTEKHINLSEIGCEKNESRNFQIVRKPLPGTIMFDKKLRVLSVRCLDGWVNFCQVVIKGRKPMSAQDFYNGFVSKVSKDLQKFNCFSEILRV